MTSCSDCGNEKALMSLGGVQKQIRTFGVRWAMPTLLMVSQNDGVIFGQALSY